MTEDAAVVVAAVARAVVCSLRSKERTAAAGVAEAAFSPRAVLVALVFAQRAVTTAKPQILLLRDLDRQQRDTEQQEQQQRYDCPALARLARRAVSS